MMLGSSFSATSTCCDPLNEWLTNVSVLGDEDKREDEDDLKRKYLSETLYVGASLKELRLGFQRAEKPSTILRPRL